MGKLGFKERIKLNNPALLKANASVKIGFSQDILFKVVPEISS